MNHTNDLSSGISLLPSLPLPPPWRLGMIQASVPVTAQTKEHILLARSGI